VRVQGSQNSLQTVADQDVKLIVDCSKIAEPGTYTLPVKVDVPRELIVLKYEPAEIVVHIEEER
jgi:YbbR domain-containing protein